MSERLLFLGFIISLEGVSVDVRRYRKLTQGQLLSQFKRSEAFIVLLHFTGGL